MKKWILLVLPLLFACATAGNNAFNREYKSKILQTTLYVDNSSMESLRIYDPFGFRIGTIFAGRKDCFELSPGVRRGQLKISVIGGGIYYTPEMILDPLTYPGLRLDLGNDLNTSVVSLRPWPRCK